MLQAGTRRIRVRSSRRTLSCSATHGGGSTKTSRSTFRDRWPSTCDIFVHLHFQRFAVTFIHLLVGSHLAMALLGSCVRDPASSSARERSEVTYS
jgi:hypothetical protein